MLEAFEKAAAFTRMGAGKGWNITISHGGNMRDAVLAKAMLQNQLPDCTYEICELACALLNHKKPRRMAGLFYSM